LRFATPLALFIADAKRLGRASAAAASIEAWSCSEALEGMFVRSFQFTGQYWAII
jgi:hypothetical protein